MTNLYRLACLVAAAVACLPSQAANLQISPVSITFKLGQAAAGITLQNQGETAVYGQVRAFAWSQRDGEDVLTETADVIVSPPILEIGPQAAQTIRLVRRGGPALASEEGTYRLLIDEIPRGTGLDSGVDILLRYSVPVFIEPGGTAAPILSWSVTRENGEWSLRVSNSGRMHAQLGATRLHSPTGGQYEVSKGLLGYVLPGQQRRWKLPTEASSVLGRQLVVHAVVNARPTTSNIEH